MLTDAELLLGLSRHLSSFAVNAATAQLDSVAFAGRVYEMAWRLRGSGVSSLQRVSAIAVEAGVRPRELRSEILPTMQQLGWIEVQTTRDGEQIAITELLPPPAQLLSEAGRVLSIALPTPHEIAALAMLRLTSRQPLERETAIDSIVDECDVPEDMALAALGSLKALGLVTESHDSSGRSAVFNPNVWIDDSEVTRAALRAEDAKVNAEVGALIEEVAKRPGMPESHVQSTEERWINFAVAHGLIHRSVVQTTDGDEQRFLFTPHLLRDPFGGRSLDASGHARQLVGSMIYAATFADYKLTDPATFVRSLIRYGEAGNASPIGTDYPMLETAGIVRVVPGTGRDRFRFELLQADVAEQALELLTARADSAGTTSQAATKSALRDQRSYMHVEKDRAIARVADIDPEHRRRLIAALRDTSTKGRFDGNHS